MTTSPCQAEAYLVDAQISNALTLPVSAFTAPEFLKHELETIFKNSWIPLPLRSSAALRQDNRSLEELVALRGNRTPFHLLSRPYFLQRDWESNLRAFSNTCTHAWYPLVHGNERDKYIVCGQHGRKFDCQGKFVSQPGFSHGVLDFPRDCDHLRPLPIRSFSKLLFTNLDSSHDGFEEGVSPIRKATEHLPWNQLQRVSLAEEEREVAGNWKQHAWNYMDHFHVGHIHRAPGGLADAIELGSYQTELYSRSALQWVFARNPEHGFTSEQLPNRFMDKNNPHKRVFALWAFLFPNLTLNFYPWGLSINVYNPIPGRPDTTLFQWYHFTWNPKLYEHRDDFWHSHDTDQEDIDALQQLSQVIQGGDLPRGRFSPTKETGAHWFHRLIFESAFNHPKG